MDTHNYGLREVLDNLNDYLDGLMERYNNPFNCYTIRPDNIDSDQRPLADESQLYVVPKKSGLFYLNGCVYYVPFETVYYPNNCGFNPQYTDYSGLLINASILNGETRGEKLKSRETMAIDIIDPETGEKLKFY